MERTQKLVVHLDTHVLLWLYNQETAMLSAKAKSLMAQSRELWVSPMVMLEAQYMYEIRRLKAPAATVAKWLKEKTIIKITPTSFLETIEKAKNLSWTRDAFDRIITASALADNATLITKDRVIRKHYKKAIW